jgi:hypothetical protein
MREIIIKKGDEPFLLIMAILIIYMWSAPLLYMVDMAEGKIGDINRFAPLKHYYQQLYKK